MKIALSLIIGACLALSAVTAVARELQPASLRAAAKYSAKHRGLSLLVIQHGRTLFAESADKPHRIYSGTKAFWNLAALAAEQDGLLNLDEPVADSIPQWRNDSRKAHVTVRQLLDFSAGLAPVFALHNNNAKDRDKTAIAAPLVAEPGHAFIYGPSALQVFYEVLKKKLRDQSPIHYLEHRVLRRLGLGSAALSARSRGQSVACIGLGIDGARLGETRQARSERRPTGHFARSACAKLARLIGKSRLLVRLVEQSRCADWSRIRFRKYARSQMVAAKLASGLHFPRRSTGPRRLHWLGAPTPLRHHIFGSRRRSTGGVGLFFGRGVSATTAGDGVGATTGAIGAVRIFPSGVAIMSDARLGCHW